ncbi:MAG: hypothetical protein M3R63_11495 [Actinomycetota bacterium]|nr:hypothetical protein [Actinomycetota bacterium]
MKEMILLFVVWSFTTLAVGVLLGTRFEEINLRVRERRLAEERRRVTAQSRALKAHHEVNNLIWQAQNEIRQAALLQAHDLPIDIHLEPEAPTAPSYRAGSVGTPVNGSHAAAGVATP